MSISPLERSFVPGEGQLSVFQYFIDMQCNLLGGARTPRPPMGILGPPAPSMGLVATTWEPGLPLGPHLGILTALIIIIRVMTKLMLYMILMIKLEQTRFASLQPQSALLPKL